MKKRAGPISASQRSIRVLWLMAGGALLAVLTLACLFVRPSHADDATAGNVVEQLQKELDGGTAQLRYDSAGHGYLPALLQAFRIPRNSQLLVFSASSLQFDRINQETPRALYYQDNVSVGSVQGGRLIEIMAADKDSGVAFYTLDVAKADKPRFIRRTGECIICHGFVSRWAPGMMVANYDTGPGGQLLNLDPFHLFHLTDDRTPFEERYGGWYLTGTSGSMKHRGNVTLEPANSSALPGGGLNLVSLKDRLDTTPYLESGSDIVSLLTLEHQAGFVNLVTKINAQYRGLNNTSLVPALRATQSDIDSSLEELVLYMTFADEVALPSPVSGTSGFAETFSNQGPRDGKGRSLRTFDLKHRLFRYPLSYMIYSQTFNDLNPAAKTHVLRRIYEILGGTEKGVSSASARSGEGAAAINILAATMQGLPNYWKPVPEVPAQKS